MNYETKIDGNIFNPMLQMNLEEKPSPKAIDIEDPDKVKEGTIRELFSDYKKPQGTHNNLVVIPNPSKVQQRARKNWYYSHKHDKNFHKGNLYQFNRVA